MFTLIYICSLFVNISTLFTCIYICSQKVNIKYYSFISFNNAIAIGLGLENIEY
jgi:hypothetical protein